MQAARKVYNTALGSLPSTPGTPQQHTASLALAFAESELRRGGNQGKPRAVHVLAWLGRGSAFQPFKPPITGKSKLASPMSPISKPVTNAVFGIQHNCRTSPCLTHSSEHVGVE